MRNIFQKSQIPFISFMFAILVIFILNLTSLLLAQNIVYKKDTYYIIPSNALNGIPMIMIVIIVIILVIMKLRKGWWEYFSSATSPVILRVLCGFGFFFILGGHLVSWGKYIQINNETQKIVYLWSYWLLVSFNIAIIISIPILLLWGVNAI